MSNPDLPRSYYWQDQDDAGYGPGWRAGAAVPPRGKPAWDDGGGFWRDEPSPGSGERDARHHRHQAPRYREGQPPARGSGRPAGRARRAPDGDRADWTGRLSQTAGELRSRLGMLARAAGSREDDAWSGPAGRRAVPAPGEGRRGLAGGGPGRSTGRAAHAAGYGDAGYGDAGYGDAGYGDAGYGDAGYGDAGYGDGLAGRRTALRDQAGDPWADGNGTGLPLRSRVAERPGTRRAGAGGGGAGRGGRGRGPAPRSAGERFTNWLLYGRWWRHWTWKKALAVVGAGTAAFFLLGIATFFILYEMTPIPTAAEQAANWQSSTVSFANGKQMGLFDGGGIDRMLLTPAQIPPVMTEAITASEDRHFYTEGGVSLTGLMRAAYEDVFGSGNLQGASTITMQYAKNYYNGVDTGRNLSTKLKEVFIAMKLGRQKSKSWVMTNYLNTVPFGPTIDGLGAAAENYFNVNLTQPGAKLTLGQAAMLAAMPNNPSVLNPDPHAGIGYTLLVQRFNYVLGNMVRDQNITAAEAKATKFPVLHPPPGGNGETGYTGYLMNMVEQQLEAPYADGGYNLTQQQIDTGGYKIRTTFSLAKVRALARAVSDEKAQMRALAAAGGGTPFRSYDRIGAVLENSKNGAIVAVYGGPGYLSNKKRCDAANCDINMAEAAEQVGSSFKPYVLSTAVREDMSVFTSKLNGYSPIWIPLSTPGGSAATERALSHTTPPPGCPRANSPNASPCHSTNGTWYFLFNETGENFGTLAVNKATAWSSDAAYEDLVHRDGIQSVIDMAQLFGVGQNAFVEPCGASIAKGATTVGQTIADCNDLTGPGYKVGKNWYQGNGLETNFSPNTTDYYARHFAGTPGSPQMALGENPLTPVEQATTFATLADDGVYHTPHVIESVQRNGSTLASHLITRTVLSPAAAADVDYALSFDNNMAGATADTTVSFRRGGVIAKTGTLGVGAVASQAWFVGATPRQDALSVALFTNDPGTQNLDNLPTVNGAPGAQGGGWPASIWNSFMTAQFSKAPYTQLFPTVQNGFVPWVQVQPTKPKPKQTCKPNHYTKGCTCPQGSRWCGQQNPQRPCHGNGKCGGAPQPSPTCQASGSTGCTSASPSPTPTASTAAYLRGSPGSGSSPVSAPGIVVLAAEEAATRLTAWLGLAA